MTNRENEQQRIMRQLMWVAVLDVQGAVLVVAGLLARFSPATVAEFPMLGDAARADRILLAGIVLMAWCGWRFFRLMRQRRALPDVD